MIVKPSRIFPIILILCGILPTPARAQTFNDHAFLWTATGGMQDLGVPAGWTDSLAYAVSNNGDVVGELFNSSTGNGTAALWSNLNGWHALKKGLSSQYSAALGVNDSGQIVGATYTTGTTQHAFLWTVAGGMQDLGTLGGNFSVAYGINQLGQVVGQSTTVSGSYHAFEWTQSTGMQDLGVLDTSFGGGSVAYAINDDGVIAGASTAKDGLFAAVLWQGGVIRRIDVAIGNANFINEQGPASSAYALNDLGQVTGAESPSNSRTGSDAFLWNSAGVQDLGLLSGAISSTGLGISRSGEVVGWDLMSDASQQAFLWTSADGMQTLGTLGGPNSVATGINDSGQVAGYSDVP